MAHGVLVAALSRPAISEIAKVKGMEGFKF